VSIRDRILGRRPIEADGDEGPATVAGPSRDLSRCSLDDCEGRLGPAYGVLANSSTIRACIRCGYVVDLKRMMITKG